MELIHYLKLALARAKEIEIKLLERENGSITGDELKKFRTGDRSFIELCKVLKPRFEKNYYSFKRIKQR